MSDKARYKLLTAIFEQRYSDASVCIEAEPNLIEQKDSLGETALHFLAVENNLEGVSWLFEKGANINTKNDFGTPVIFEVAQLGYKELFNWFYKNGVELDCKDNENLNIIEYLIQYDKEEMANYVSKYLAN